METVITTDQLSRHFGKKIAVDQLSLQVERGEVFGLLGHNGAGKTTTIRLLNGVLSATHGHATVLGLNPHHDGAELRQRTGVLTENPALDERLSGRANLSYHAAIYGIPKQEVRRRVDDTLSQFGLLARADDRVGGYSKGMRQRLSLARTILHNPELIFLDEPTSGLDPVAIREVHQLITRLSRDEQRTVILCTHNLYEAQRLCQRVAVMAQGKLLAAGTPTELGERFGYAHRLQIEVDPAQVGQTTALVRQWRATSEIEELNTGDGHLRIKGVSRNETPNLVALLAGAGICLFRVLPEEASLEDVYFVLQGLEHPEQATGEPQTRGSV